MTVETVFITIILAGSLVSFTVVLFMVNRDQQRKLYQRSGNNHRNPNRSKKTSEKTVEEPSQ